MPTTGDIANEWCPTTQREWFKPRHRAGADLHRATRRPIMHELEKFGREVGEALKDLLGL